MPKIVHVTSVHPAMDTRVFLKECRGLAAARYDVVLVVADADGDRQVDGVQVRAVGVPRSRRDRTFRAGWACVRQGLRERADVLHFHDPELLPSAQMLRRMGKRVVYDMHEFAPTQTAAKTVDRPRLRAVFGRVWRSVERQLLRDVPVVFAARSLALDYPYIDRSEVVENMPLVEALLAIREEPYERFTLGYMGSLTVSRGSLQLMGAVDRLRRDGIAVEVECVGAAHDAPTAEALRRAAGLAEQQKLTSFYFLRRAGRAGARARCPAGSQRCCMKVSVIIPCYRERDFIGGCLDSVLAFELPPYVTSRCWWPMACPAMAPVTSWRRWPRATPGCGCSTTRDGRRRRP